MNKNYNSNRTTKIPMWKCMFAIFVTLITVTLGNAQVTTNGGSGLNPTYPDLSSAITALNGATISSPVVITLDPANPQTAPAGGYAITAQGDPTNTILIQGSGNTITASNALVAGTLTDAIFKLVGADYVTLQNFTMQENAANLTTAAATNNMTEWGVALLYATATNGAQNNTIQNNTISLNRVYQNTFGIYSNTRHTAIVVTVIADVTSAAGANSFNKVYGNAISNVNYGTVFIGSGAVTASSFMDNGNDIGGSSAITGNTYTNWGGIGTAISGYASVTGSNYCIFDNNQYNDNISYNTITSFVSASGLTMGGILKNYSTGTTGQPTGTITTTINNNTVTITNNPTVVAGSIIGINNQGLSPLLATATMSMNNNVVQNFVLGGSTVTTGGITAITNLSLPGTMNMNGNSVINNAITATTSTTGINAGIANSGAAGTLNMNNNTVRSLSSTATTTGQIQGVVNSGAIVTTLNMNNNFLGNATSGFCSRSVASTGSTFGIITSGGSATCNTSIQSNDIRGINYTVASSGSQSLIQNTAATLSQNISSNTFTNLAINTTGGVTFISNNVTRPANAICNVNNNAIVGSFSKTGAGGTITFYNSNSTTPTSGTENNLNNNFSNITITGATTIAGWISTDGSGTSPFGPGKNVSNNTFNNITGGTSSITVLSVGYSNNGLTTNNVSNNTISNITNGASITGIVSPAAPQNFFGNAINSLTATGASTVSAIQVTGGTTQNIYKNKIYNLEANNAAGVVNGILASGGTTVSLYNNIIGDLRTPASNLANPLNGINITGGTTVNAYNNTVMLNATSSGALFGSSAVSVATGTTVALRNNIFVNNSTVSGAGLAVAYRRSSTTLASYDAASNNNLFYASSIFTDGTNTDATLGAYKTRVASRDASSINENPTFVSTVGGNANFLHIDTTVGTLIEGGGANVAAVTDDFDGDVRNATTPDIGADEFAGVPISVVVINSVAINPVGNQCTAVARTITADITAGGNNITSVTLNYSFDGVAQTPVAMTGGTLTAGTTSTFTGTIPVAVPVNANVTWNVTAVDPLTSKATSGTPYQDEPLFGSTATANASVVSLCSGGSTVLSATLVKNGTKNAGSGSLTTTGSGTSSTNYVSPFTHWYGGYKAQYIVRASELTALGFSAGNNLTSLAFDVTTASTVNYTGFTLRMGSTPATVMTTTFDTSSLTQVYTGDLAVSATGLLTLPFGTGTGSSASYTWDGTSNVLINLCWSNNNGGGAVPGSAEVKYDTTSFVAMAYYRVDTNTPAAVCGTATATATLSNRPKMVFGGNFAPAITSISWFDGSTVVGTGNNLSVSPTVNTTYTATLTASGCTIGTNAIAVTVNTTPAPTGAATQTFANGQTLADIVVTGTSIIWYASASDAASAINPLSNATLLVDNAIYYATQTVSGCASTASLAVTADVALGVNNFDSSAFKLYPNPVNDMLNLSYAQELTNLEIFNFIGQRVYVKKINTKSIKVDMSNFAQGAYFIKVSSGEVTKTIKVIKN